ncbi:MAG: hypothetical protein MUP82_02435 [Candidatus Marinimicrobia bacterium]|nr:hypothetical protein [Candidatus Neomarinimicrobiota bacterium]
MNKIIIGIGICAFSILIMNCTKSTIKKETILDSNTVATDQYTEFNQRVRKAGNIVTPIELIKYYLGEIDADQDIDISVAQVENNQYEITLIQGNVKDDSIAGIKIIMVAKNDNNQWTVLDIQRTWKCQKGHGPSKFSKKLCN